MNRNNLLLTSDLNDNLFLLFEMSNNNYYALNCANILEIMPILQLENPQKLPQFVAGFLNYSGLNINVIDFREILNIELTPYKLSDCIIIVRTNESIFALIVNKIIDIILVDKDKMQAVPSNYENNLINFVFQHENQNISSIDVFWLEDILKEGLNHQSKINFSKLFPQDQKDIKVLEERRNNLYTKTKFVLENACEKESFLQFKIDSLNLAINIKYVKEIVKLTHNKIVSLPSIPEYISKLVSIRGNYINALDLKLFMGLSESKNEENYKNLIILNIENLNLGLLANEIFDIEPVGANNFIIKADSKFESLYISSEFCKNGKIFSILNIDKIINDKKLYIKQSN